MVELYCFCFVSENTTSSPPVSPPASDVRRVVELWNPLTVRCRDRQEETKRDDRNGDRNSDRHDIRDGVTEIKMERDDPEDVTMEDELTDDAARREEEVADEVRSQSQVQFSLLHHNTYLSLTRMISSNYLFSF